MIGLAALLGACAHSQPESDVAPRLVGGPCEGCEAVLEYGDGDLGPDLVLPDFDEDGQRIKVTGKAYQPDGRTPAADVILYVYHTDQQGIYPTRGDETGWGRRHGYIRGWLETGPDGRYAFYTLKPAAYPDSTLPAHIHLTVLEPDGRYYWLGSYLFAGDPHLTERERSPAAPRGGSAGLLELKQEGDLWVGVRDIVLGKNVPGYK
jgi:protocatechuate 3,4-dioxygenase beta subunit